jgi:hypothetical protein
MVTQTHNMKKIRYLDIGFEEEIKPWELGFFRGAVIQLAGKQNILFHNHDKDKYRYSYPLIQYKRIDHRPHITCINEGVEEIHNFFEKKQEGIVLGNRPYNLIVNDINLKHFTMQAWDSQFRYYLQEWMPINSKNLSVFMDLKSEQAKKDFFKPILVGNILSMAKGLDWYVEKEIEVKIDHIKGIRTIRTKGVEMFVVTLTFLSNVSLPTGIGLGKNAGTGHGVIRSLGK